MPSLQKGERDCAPFFVYVSESVPYREMLAPYLQKPLGGSAAACLKLELEPNALVLVKLDR
jgi:hypothetical protein